MNLVAATLAPFALLLPALALELPDGPRSDRAARSPVGKAAPPTGFDAVGAEPFRSLKEASSPPVANQVRIEQRVIIRIAPSSPATTEQALAGRQGRPQSFEERHINGCIPIESIAGVQATEENRLLLFMRDRRILTAALERSCSAADYYAGFYLERNEDGQLCPRRDKLQSRAGASCRVTQLSRLVVAQD